MDQQLAIIFANMSSLFLIGALVAALFFTGAALREIKSDFLQGLLFLAVAVFFVAAHLYYLLNIPEGSRFAAAVSGMDIWGWGVMMLAPSLIAIYLVRGIFDLMRSQSRAALTQLFFGLTLLCLIYMIGRAWPLDFRAIVTAFYGYTWFAIEHCAR